MKYCVHCGKEIMDAAVICVHCGCAVEKQVAAGKQVEEIYYDDCVKNAAITNIISAVVIALGIVCWLVVNMWIGAALCLAAEIIALIPNSKVQKAFKNNGLTGKSKEIRDEQKGIIRALKQKYPAYSFSKVLAIIALVLLIIFVMFI